MWVAFGFFDSQKLEIARKSKNVVSHARARARAHAHACGRGLVSLIIPVKTYFNPGTSLFKNSVRARVRVCLWGLVSLRIQVKTPTEILQPRDKSI